MEQLALVEMIVACDPDSMTEPQRLRLVSMVAAYVGIPFSHVRVEAVTRANSSRIRIRLPKKAAELLVSGFQLSDPRLRAFLEDIEVLDIQAVQPDAREPPRLSVTEPGLVRALLVDHDTDFLEEIKSRLESERGIAVGWSPTRNLEEVPDALYAQADVVLTDLRKHGPELADAVSKVKSRFGHLQFLIIGSAEEDAATMILLESGARGYLDLQTSGDNLASAIWRLASGGTWIPPHILGRYLDLIQMVEFLPQTGAKDDPWAKMTAREQRVLMMMACGKRDWEISSVIGVHESIVGSTIQQLMHRTGAVNRPSLIAYYLYHKLFRYESVPAIHRPVEN